LLIAVKSWEDQILGALVAAPATVKDHAKLEQGLTALFFFWLTGAPLPGNQRNSGTIRGRLARLMPK